jgi:hypothetical protein
MISYTSKPSVADALTITVVGIRDGYGIPYQRGNIFLVLFP